MSGSMTRSGTGTELARTDDYDPYAAYGATATLQGLFLSFKNNEFLYGQEGASLPLGTRLVAFMPGLRHGWRKWQNAKVDQDLTELIADRLPGQVLPPRHTLGDLDQSLWEADDDGKPRDPWQETNILELANAEKQRFIYSTWSKGGLNAVKRLTASYSQLRKQKPDLLPVIELKSSFYMHSKYGKTYVPDFPIVGWVDPETLEPEEEIPFDPETGEVAQTAAPTSTIWAAAVTARSKPAAAQGKAAEATNKKPRF